MCPQCSNMPKGDLGPSPLESKTQEQQHEGVTLFSTAALSEQQDPASSLVQVGWAESLYKPLGGGACFAVSRDG